MHLSLILSFIEIGRSRYQIDIPYVTDYGNKQNENILTAFADIVHSPENERNGRKQFDNAKQSKRYYRKDAERVYHRLEAH